MQYQNRVLSSIAGGPGIPPAVYAVYESVPASETPAYANTLLQFQQRERFKNQSLAVQPSAFRRVSRKNTIPYRNHSNTEIEKHIKNRQSRVHHGNSITHPKNDTFKSVCQPIDLDCDLEERNEWPRKIPNPSYEVTTIKVRTEQISTIKPNTVNPPPENIPSTQDIASHLLIPETNEKENQPLDLTTRSNDKSQNDIKNDLTRSHGLARSCDNAPLDLTVKIANHVTERDNDVNEIHIYDEILTEDSKSHQDYDVFNLDPCIKLDDNDNMTSTGLMEVDTDQQVQCETDFPDSIGNEQPQCGILDFRPTGEDTCKTNDSPLHDLDDGKSEPTVCTSQPELNNPSLDPPSDLKSETDLTKPSLSDTKTETVDNAVDTEKESKHMEAVDPDDLTYMDMYLIRDGATADGGYKVVSEKSEIAGHKLISRAKYGRLLPVSYYKGVIILRPPDEYITCDDLTYVFKCQLISLVYVLRMYKIQLINPSPLDKLFFQFANRASRQYSEYLASKLVSIKTIVQRFYEMRESLKTLFKHRRFGKCSFLSVEIACIKRGERLYVPLHAVHQQYFCETNYTDFRNAVKQLDISIRFPTREENDFLRAKLPRDCSSSKIVLLRELETEYTKLREMLGLSCLPHTTLPYA